MEKKSCTPRYTYSSTRVHVYVPEYTLVRTSTGTSSSIEYRHCKTRVHACDSTILPYRYGYPSVSSYHDSDRSTSHHHHSSMVMQPTLDPCMGTQRRSSADCRKMQYWAAIYGHIIYLAISFIFYLYYYNYLVPGYVFLYKNIFFKFILIKFN